MSANVNDPAALTTSGPGAPGPRRSVLTRWRNPCSCQLSMRAKILLWTGLLIVVPTWACSIWLNHHARSVLATVHARNVEMIGQTIAGSIARAMSRGSAAVRDELETLDLDSRLAFVSINSADGRPIHRRTFDAPAWQTYLDWEKRQVDRRGYVDFSDTIFLSKSLDLALRKVPIWEPGSELNTGRKFIGSVTLAMREKHLPAAFERLTAMQMISAGVVCALCLPMVLLAAQRWTAPLRKLRDATQALAAGQQVEPIPVHSADELGQLAEGFNDMAQSLWAARALLQDVNEQLERKVERRTAELEHAKRQLEGEIKEKNEFLRAVSHDLGAPLRNISGLAAMLLLKYKTDLADDAVNKLERIRANVTTQVDLINDLLELSRIKTRPGKRQPVDLDALVRQQRDSLSYDLERNGITLRITQKLPTITADPNRLRQVFQNLLDNAVKFMLDSPRREIEVSFAEEKDALHFVVSDTGCGVPIEDQPHIFDVFRRSSRSASVPGRGIGLAGVKSIVETYGGRIWLESRPGEGCRFHFTLSRAAIKTPLPCCEGFV